MLASEGIRWQTQATVETQLKMGLGEGIKEVGEKCFLGEVEEVCHLEHKGKKY